MASGRRICCHTAARVGLGVYWRSAAGRWQAAETQGWLELGVRCRECSRHHLRVACKSNCDGSVVIRVRSAAAIFRLLSQGKDRVRQMPLCLAVLNVRFPQAYAVAGDQEPLRVNSRIVNVPMQRYTDLVEQQHQDQQPTGKRLHSESEAASGRLARGGRGHGA